MMDRENFIRKASEIHNNRYDYSLSVVHQSKKKIKIICAVHGVFEQSSSNHISRKSGCPACAVEERAKNGRIAKGKTFAERAAKVHKGFYDYSKSVYTGVEDYIDIICLLHGVFKQKAGEHLQGNGCKKCATARQLSDTETFVSKAKVKHGETYDYSLVNYVHAQEKVSIICKKHGAFDQVACYHLSGNGCPKCGNHISSSATKWLDSLNVPLREYRFKPKTGRVFPVDGYDPATETVYQFHGDYWHGNIRRYNPKEINKINKKTFGELYNRTIARDSLIRRTIAPSGKPYKLVTIWEMDWQLTH